MSAPSNAWTAGQQLGPYELLGPIGAGGMGEVWKARDTRLGRTVAVKRLKGQHSARFEQEARAIAALNHPHICTLYDIGADYLVMELIEGAPPKSPLPTKEAVQVALQIAGALEAAHAKGILHRDLKPGNILITTAGAKLLDFGLAKHTGDSGGDATVTMEGTVAGTAAYMSPEQARGEALDARSDIFSFGTVLYELLAGHRAFTGVSATDVLSAVIRAEPAKLDAPPDLTRIVDRCLRKSREERYGSMSEVRAALEQAKLESTEQPSIAVLPFANMSRDPDDEYFSDGLAEEIINQLAHVPELKVTARTSAFAFRGKEQDIRKIAEALSVRTILEGSVRRAGKRIRVTAQLINAADGYHIWSERYDRDMVDVFEVQDEISAAISEALQTKLSPQTAAAKQRYTPKLPAYEALLKAKHFHWQVTFESMERADRFYRQAIELDPNYALAYASYSDYLGGRAVMGMSSSREVMPECRRLAHKALELDPTQTEAHVMLGFAAGPFEYDWQEADRQFAIVATDGSRSSWCRMSLAWMYHMYFRRYEEAVRELELAIQQDPLHLTVRQLAGVHLAAAGRDRDAEEILQKALEISPDYFWTYTRLAEFHAARGRFAQALPFAEDAFTRGPWYSPNVGIYAGCLSRLGQQEKAEEVIGQLGAGESYGGPIGFAIYHLCREEIDLSANWFAKAIEERYLLLSTFLMAPIGDPVRNSFHWPRLAAMMNLPERT